MGGGSLYALFLSWAAYYPEELSLARIAADDYATASDSPAYPGSLDEPAGRPATGKLPRRASPTGGICRPAPAGTL
jgi:hypothetical protein